MKNMNGYFRAGVLLTAVLLVVQSLLILLLVTLLQLWLSKKPDARE